MTFHKTPERQRFAQCGFTDRTAAVLIKAGIDVPERLLAMSSDSVRLIQGIGPVLIKEIERYRARFWQQRDKTPTRDDHPGVGES